MPEAVYIRLRDTDVLTASKLAELMYKRGQCVMEVDAESDFWINEDGTAYESPDLTSRNRGLDDIRVGDVLFFAERWDRNDGTGEEPGWLTFIEDGFMNISHAAVVTKAEHTYNGWYHEITEVISKAYAYYHGGHFSSEHWDDAIAGYTCDAAQTRPLWVNPISDATYADPMLAWGQTLVMVCRPNLQAASMDNNLTVEAQKIGLHETPKNWGVLNAIKRARQYTDVKWTPATNLERNSQICGVDISADDAPFYEGDLFEAGVEYTGIPALKDHREDNPSSWIKDTLGLSCGLDAFVSGVGVPGTASNVFGMPQLSWPVWDYSDICKYAWDVWNDNSNPEEDESWVEFPLDSFELGDYVSGNISYMYGNDETQEATTGIITDIIRVGDEVKAVEICEFNVGGVVNVDDLGGQHGGLASRHWISFEEYSARYDGGVE